MKPALRLTATSAAAGAAMLPPLRAWLEADMARHMLLQLPLLLLAGALLALSLSAGARRRLAAWNAHGLSGLLLCLLVSAFWMIPRALDAALFSPWVAAAKFGTLIAAGAALPLSWRPAGPVVQAFFIGNWAWMSATAGLLYQDSTARLCNAYLLEQQAAAGHGLVAFALLVPLGWAVALGRRGDLTDGRQGGAGGAMPPARGAGRERLS